MKPDRNVEKADVLVNHAVYNITMVEKYIKPGYKLIVPVREPVSWFKSAVNYRFNVSVPEVVSSLVSLLSMNRYELVRTYTYTL